MTGLDASLGRAAGLLSRVSTLAHGTGPLQGTRLDELRSAQGLAATVRHSLADDADGAIATLGLDGATALASARGEVFAGRMLLRQALDDTNLGTGDGVRLANRLADRAGTHFDAAARDVSSAAAHLDR